MDYPQILEKLETLATYFKAINEGAELASAEHLEEIYMLYGELEEVINRFAGIEKIEVQSFSSNKPLIFSNYIAARMFSGRTFFHMRDTFNF